MKPVQQSHDINKNALNQSTRRAKREI